VLAVRLSVAQDAAVQLVRAHAEAALRAGDRDRPPREELSVAGGESMNGVSLRHEQQRYPVLPGPARPATAPVMPERGYAQSGFAHRGIAWVPPAGCGKLGGVERPVGYEIPRWMREGEGMSVDEATMRGNGGASFDDQVFERLLRERIIFLGSEVNDEVTNRICAQMLLLASSDSERDIALYINSPGGSISAGMAVYDTMQYIKNDVATIAMGMAASMGQFLLCAGTPGKRYALPHARIMMHQLSGGIGGTAADIAIQAESMLHIKHVMNDRIAFHTGRTAEEVERDADRDRWFTAEQAREYGIVDHVISKATDVMTAGSII